MNRMNVKTSLTDIYLTYGSKRLIIVRQLFDEQRYDIIGMQIADLIASEKIEDEKVMISIQRLREIIREELNNG